VGFVVDRMMMKMMMIFIWGRALTVRMHLSFINGPFVSHNLISAQGGPVPLLKFHMAPRLKLLMSSGSKKREQRYAFSFFLLFFKVPASEPHSRFHNRAPMERASRLQGLFTLSRPIHIDMAVKNTTIFM